MFKNDEKFVMSKHHVMHSCFTAKKRRKSYFDSTSDLFFHICIKTVNILVQI